MNERIFIQIASYRDSELNVTIENCIENAEYPERLKFGICWQHGEEEYLEKWINDPRFKIISVHYSHSKGACWARHLLQQLFDDEEFTLQLDSHHRFVKGWDKLLIDMYKDLQLKGFNKPLITAYLPSYEPSTDPIGRVLTPWKLKIDKITEDKMILFNSDYILDHQNLTSPIKGFLYSAHFAFSSGQFVKEIPHDPNLYFTGEEMNITIRAFTHGYDIFHSHILIAWHEYTRKHRIKVWDDDKEWWKKDAESKKHYHKLFRGEIINKKYCLGTKRTLEDFKEVSNIDLLHIYCSQNTSNTNANTNAVDQKEIVVDDMQTNTTKDKEISIEWKNWIKTNLDLGVGKEVIIKILMDSKFNKECIDKELNSSLLPTDSEKIN